MLVDSSAVRLHAWVCGRCWAKKNPRSLRSLQLPYSRLQFSEVTVDWFQKKQKQKTKKPILSQPKIVLWTPVKSQHQRFPGTRWVLDKYMPSEGMSASVSWIPRSPCLYCGQIGLSETSRTHSRVPHCSFKISPVPTQHISTPHLNLCTAQLRNFCCEVFKFLPSVVRITFFLLFLSTAICLHEHWQC